MEIGKTYHTQLSIDAARWPDEMLEGLIRVEGKPLSGKGAHKLLVMMRKMGYEMVPCECPGAQDPPGRCPGFVQEPGRRTYAFRTR